MWVYMTILFFFLGRLVNIPLDIFVIHRNEKKIFRSFLFEDGKKFVHEIGKKNQMAGSANVNKIGIYFFSISYSWFIPNKRKLKVCLTTTKNDRWWWWLKIQNKQKKNDGFCVSTHTKKTDSSGVVGKKSDIYWKISKSKGNRYEKWTERTNKKTICNADFWFDFNGQIETFGHSIVSAVTQTYWWWIYLFHSQIDEIVIHE